MSGFRQLGGDATLQQVLDQRRNDAAVIDNILTRLPRNRTGLRAAPADELETLAGDLVGDIIYDFTGNKKYELTNNNGTLQWVRWTIETTF
jgi:hypothetical protein